MSFASRVGFTARLCGYRFYSGRTASVMWLSRQSNELRMMAKIIDRMELRNDQRLELHEEGVTSIMPAAVASAQVAHEIKLDAAATARVVDAFRLKNIL